MIKVEINGEKNKSSVEIEGRGPVILAELIAEIGVIYKSFARESEDMADVFKELLKHAIEEDLPFSTDEELAEKAESAKKEAEEAKAKREDIERKLADLLAEAIIGGFK